MEEGQEDFSRNLSSMETQCPPLIFVAKSGLDFESSDVFVSNSSASGRWCVPASITENEPQKALSSGRGKRRVRNGPCEVGAGETKPDCSFGIPGVSQKYAVVLIQDFLCKSIAFGFK